MPVQIRPHDFPPEALEVRVMNLADLSAADHLRQLAGWNQTPDDWARFLDFEPVGCFVATEDGLVRGTVTTLTYGAELAWIGMMLVDPEHRRRGIATRLMERALGYLQAHGVKCVKLDATPAGHPLYGRLGFIVESSLTRWHRPGPEAAGSGKTLPGTTRRLTERDWPAIEQMDLAAFGAPRLRLLKALLPASRKALVWPAAGGVSGWGLLREGSLADYLGPVECQSARAASVLIPALLGETQNRAVFWDIPDENKPARRMAESLGFAPIRPLARMRLGPATLASSPEALYAIACPAVG